MKRILMISFLAVSLFIIFLSTLSEASECILIEPEEMKKRYEDRSILLNDMFIFDTRPYMIANKGKRIPMSMAITYESLENKLAYEIEVWKGKDLYLVGEDTESTKSFCKAIVEKKYPIDDIYVLKGGMNTWDGPIITGKFEDVKCEEIDLQKLLNLKDSEGKIEFVDMRSIQDYERGHIPGAVGEGAFSRENLCLTGVFSRAVQNDSIVVFVGYTEAETVHRCRVLKWAVGYNNMHALKGNMKAWKGTLEKGRFAGRY
ncbi:MAG: rhodanese-like domain-containing protein [Nitrospinota bacterium]